MKAILAVWIALLISPINALSQSSNATLSGTVEDSTHAVLQIATVTAKNLDTGIVTTTRTNSAGAYYFAALQPGLYDVRAQAPQFQPKSYGYVYLGQSQQIRLNFELGIGPVDQTLEVFLPPGALQSTAAASGSALMAFSLAMLPTGGGNALDLVMAAPGTQGNSFAGGRPNQVNTTRDGISVNSGRYENGVYSDTYVSTDLVDEVRVLIAPADAEIGRGSGQVRLSTRSGTNQFHGTLFWSDRNSALDASTWFNNFSGLSKDYLNRNRFGGRLSGPVARNRTFFFVLYEGLRTVQKASVPAPALVLTSEARQGIFRYFPGVPNGNANSSTPTVDRLGNAVRPRTATGDLSFFNVFRNTAGQPRDPLRPGPDPTGQIQKIIDRMPLPNDFTVGDGLNRAGYRWIRRFEGSELFNGTGTDINRDQLNLRIDHHFNAAHRFFFSGTREHAWAETDLSNWPGGYNGSVVRHPQVYTVSLVSTLSPTILNEFRAGLRRGRSEYLQAYDVPGKSGEEARKLLGFNNGTPYIINTAFFMNSSINDQIGVSAGSTVPLWTYADTLTLVRGRHAFKGGAEFRQGSENAWNTPGIIPRVNIGPGAGGLAGGPPVTGINSATVPGLTGADISNATLLLTDLAGSVGNITQAFNVDDPKNIVFKDYRELYKKYRDIHQNEFSAFFKDDWKLRSDLTLNVGLRYEYYGVPYESNGLTAAPIGGGAVLEKGSTNIMPEFVGKNSPQPEKQLYKDDWNNFAPAVGLSWSLPWFGKDKTILRSGYGISYQGGSRGLFLDVGVGLFPGISQFVTHRVGSTYADFTNLSLPLPERAPPGQLLVQPLTARSGDIFGFDPNLVSPYVQNWNLSIQRQLARDWTLDLRYIGTKGTKLFANIQHNNFKVFESGLVEAFNITRAGGDAQLFDRMLKGLVINPGQPPVGSGVSGSAALRQNATTSGFFANGNIRPFANFLNSTPLFTPAGEPGGLLRNGGFPEDFLRKNPQFNVVELVSNPGNSTYHSLQTAVSKRLSHGVAFETTYTWSRALGEPQLEGEEDWVMRYVDPDNRSHSKSLLSIHRTHDLRGNGVVELPFGPGRPFARNAPSWLSRVVEQWNLGVMLSLTSGQPLFVGANQAPSALATINFPDIVGPFPKSIGKVTKTDNGVVYFDGLQQVTDPSKSTVTALQNLRDRVNLFAITDSDGRVLLQNPATGTIGNMGYQWLEGPGRLGLDLDLTKSFQLSETTSFDIKVDALNVLNHPQFGNPVLMMNMTNFGRITNATGSRTFTLSARLSF